MSTIRARSQKIISLRLGRRSTTTPVGREKTRKGSQVSAVIADTSKVEAPS